MRFEILKYGIFMYIVRVLMITFVIASVFLALNLGTFCCLLLFNKIVNHYEMQYNHPLHKNVDKNVGLKCLQRINLW
jgi:predicted membrane protein